MKNRARAFLALFVVGTLFASLAGIADAQTDEANANANQKLQMYEAVVDAATAEQLTDEGYDVVTAENVAGGVRVVIVMYPFEKKGLTKQGIDLKLWRNDAGFTATQLAEQQTSAGFKVWRDYDGPDGIAAYMHGIEAANEDILDLEVIGQTYGNDANGPVAPREILALRLTANENGSADGSKPGVLYSSLQHAREWISVEVNRRLLEWYIKMYRENRAAIVNLLQSTELWFVLVANPDGYQYTFEGDRLWRKNLRDNDNSESINVLDGVDPNRNFPEHWNFDDEGSASIFSDETYRGPAPESEPETQAMMQVWDMAQPEFHVNYHSFGELLLYSFGFQVNTPSADDPIFVALSGTDAKPAIQGYNPGVGADLYTTNGETTDQAHAREGALAWTPELGDGSHDDGFVFPDHEGEVQREFSINLPFARSVAMSAADPDDPQSLNKIDTEPFYLDVSDIDPQKSFNPMSDFTFAHSYNGASQPVQVLAKRELGPITLHWRIGNEADSASTSEWTGEDRYGKPGDLYYRIMRGTITGAEEGDTVEVWFTGGGETSESFTFEVEKTTAADVLILADEDYTGTSNFPPYTSPGPNFVDEYTDALPDGTSSDVYDVDAMGAAPDHLGVLGHYDAVIWETGNDLLSRVAGQPGGTGAETNANTMMLEVRAFLNEGGRLLFSGRHAGWQFANAFDYNPVETPPFCDNVDQTTPDGCLALSDDFLQYWLGAYIFIEDGGADADGDSHDVLGTDAPYADATTDPWEINQSFEPGREATNQSFITTSSILKPDQYGQFRSTAPAQWDTGVAGAFEPRSGDWYLYSQRADIRFQRLMRTIDVPTGDTTLSFWTSYDTEPDWDFMFVEARTPAQDGAPAQDDWTTLEELNGLNSQNTGENDPNLASCPAGWHELHPFLAHYQTFDGVGACTPTGSIGSPPGEWWAASGRSSGWEQWEVDLSQWEGRKVEVSISYAQDWAVQGLGVFLDDIDAPGTVADTSFEDDGNQLDGWTVGNPTEVGSDVNALDWLPTTDVGFTEGAMTSMAPDDADFKTLYFGFGFENVVGQAAREEILADALAYLTS
jgi:hypothetical protein